MYKKKTKKTGRTLRSVDREDCGFGMLVFCNRLLSFYLLGQVNDYLSSVLYRNIKSSNNFKMKTQKRK